MDKSFEIVFNSAKQHLGQCLFSLEKENIDTTSAMSALIWAVISLAKDADNKAIETNRPELLVDFEMVSRFSSLMISSNWKLEPGMALKFKEIAFYKPNIIVPKLLN